MNAGPTLDDTSSGDPVRRVQRILVMLKRLSPDEINGLYTAATIDAVRGFQTDSGLAADGIVGPHSWGQLPPDPGTAEVREPAQGAAVSALQGGLTTYGLDPGPVDGDFGRLTGFAVVAYQAQRGLPADGIVGDRTWWAPAGGGGATLASLAGLVTA